MRVIDKIRQMTDDELAEYLEHIGGCVFCQYPYASDPCNHQPCRNGVKEFLQKEVTSED